MSKFFQTIAVLTLAMTLVVLAGKYEQHRRHQMLANDLEAFGGELYDTSELTRLSDGESLSDKILSQFRTASRGVSLPIYDSKEGCYTDSVLAILRNVDSLDEITVRRSLHDELYPSADCLKVEAIEREFPKVRLVFAPQ